MTIIRTKRLTLRPLLASDAKAIAGLAGDWDVASMTSRIPFPYDDSLAAEWIDGQSAGDFVRGIELNGQLIGAAGYFPNTDGAIEIGYWIGKPWWGHGFATEAARALIHYCFTNAGLSKLSCCHFIDNHGSRRVIQKLGFKRIGACSAYCDARRSEVATVRYELRRPALAYFWRRAA